LMMIWALPRSTCCHYDNNGINIGLWLSMQHPRHIMYFSFTAFWWRLSLPWGDILALAYKGPTLISTHTSVGFSITDRSTFCMYKIYSEESWEKERQREELRESEREREWELVFFLFQKLEQLRLKLQWSIKMCRTHDSFAHNKMWKQEAALSFLKWV
jgi:hypothetical protein